MRNANKEINAVWYPSFGSNWVLILIRFVDISISFFLISQQCTVCLLRPEIPADSGGSHVIRMDDEI